MGLFKKLGRTIVNAATDARNQGSSQAAELLADLHFRELEGSEPFLSDWEIAKYVADAELIIASPHIDFILESGGIPRSSVESVAGSFGRRFSEFLTLRLKSLHHEGNTGQETTTRVPSVAPVGAKALDDLSGGPRVQALLWAGAQAMKATKLLQSAGADQSWTVRRLLQADASATPDLIEALLLLGHGRFHDELLESFDGPTQERLLLAAKTEKGGFDFLNSVSPAFLPTDEGRLSTASSSSVPSSSSGSTDQVAETMRDIALLNIEHFYGPLLSAGAATYAQIFDRAFMPIRIHQGTQWSPDRGLHGGPSAFEVDDQLKNDGRMAPTYFPQVLRRRRAMVLGLDTSDVLLPDYPYITDPQDAYAIRGEQILWLQQFGFRGTGH